MNPVYSIFGFKMRLKWLQGHHLYIGIGIMILALYTPFPLPIALLGAYISGDDVFQHHRQVKEPSYHSPLHRFYGKYIYKYRIIQYLNRIGDALCENPLIMVIIVALFILYRITIGG